MYRNLTRSLILIVFNFFIIPPDQIQGQDGYDEISVFINVPNVGGGEISAVIKGSELFLPVTDLFDFLKIRNIPDEGLDSISGFFINQEATYVINREENSIRFKDNIYNLGKDDLIRTESNLYLKSSFFGKVFGLECTFSFRSMTVTLNSKLELPIIREMRQEEIRKNMVRLKGEIIADTTIGRSYPMFRPGMADWSVNTTEQINGIFEKRLNLALGAMLAGGELNTSITYNSTDPFTEKQQYYLWRYVNDNISALRQVRTGKIATQSISSIYNPVIGIQITNTPTTYRRSFGSYTLSDRTEPGWVVELYVNNILVDYMKADASGFFTFEVPLVYGNSLIKLKFYGQWGEEKIREQNINIPFTFLPVKTLEYTASAGVVEDSLKSRFSRLIVNYGATRRLTIGGGVEYLSSVISGPVMPFLEASVSITNNILLSGEYTYGVKTKGTFSYRLPSNMQLDLNYTLYEKNQKAISFNYREERKATFSTPLHIGKLSSFQRLSFYQIVLPASKYTTGEWLFSGSVPGINTNLTTYALFLDRNKPLVYSNFSVAIRLPYAIILIPQFQYDFTRNKPLSGKIRLEKHLLDRAFLNLSFERNFSYNLNMAEVGLRYDFSFVQTGYSIRQSNNKTALLQYARGSLIYDKKKGYLGTDNRTNVGRGGVSVTAFLDLNSNGQKDKGEPAVHGLSLRANSGRIENSESDTTIRILGLEPYTNCFIELNSDSFENVSWRLPFKTLNVNVDPNILKNIEIPVEIVGEANGRIALDKDGELKGVERIIIGIYDKNLRIVGKTLTENNGKFSYFGLAPGKYSVRIDSVQIRKLGMISEPDSQQFNINPGNDGDIVNELDFILKSRQVDTTNITPVEKARPVIRKDTTYMIVHEVTQELVTTLKGSYSIQLGAFKKRSNAEELRKKLEKLLEKSPDLIFEDGFYKIRITGLKDRKEVDENLLTLRLNGITEVWIISMKEKQQQWINSEKQDSVIEIKETTIERAIPVVTSDLSVQAGAFHQKSYAQDLKDNLSSALKNNVMIVHENGYFKVRISGFNSTDEIEKLLPSIGRFGLKDIWILPFRKSRDHIPAVQENAIQQPVIEKQDIQGKLIEKNEIPAIEEKLIIQAPKISLQAGVFYKHSLALRAQRRITSKLKLKVEIIKQWDYYHVIIPGFYTRQETYKYYPELAGLGYDRISIMEKK